MVVRGLESYAADRKLVQQAPLSALANSRLGIQASVYFDRILNDPARREPFIAALGGIPLTFNAQLEDELRALQNNQIKPVFVWDGLPISKKGRPLRDEDLAASRRKEAWEHYENGRGDPARETFAQSSHLSDVDILRCAQRLFRQRNASAFGAPYLSTAQLVYLEQHPKSYVHAVFGSTELLLYPGVDKIVLSLDFAAGTFTFISKSALLGDLQVSHEQFLDACILAGFDHSPPMPTLAEAGFRQIVDIVRGSGSALEVLRSQGDNPLLTKIDYSDVYSRAVCMIRYSLITVAEEGHIAPMPLALPSTSTPALQPGDIPSDLHDIFSHRFPDDTYFHLCRGLITNKLLTGLATSQWVERAPPCGGESDEYKQFLRTIITEASTGPRSLALTLIAAMLHPFWGKRPVQAVYYFDPLHDHPIPHHSNEAIAMVERVTSWNVDIATVEEELRRQTSSTIDIMLCLGATSNSNLANRTRTQKRDERKMEKKDEIVANTIWRFLDMRGLIRENHTHSAYGKALYAALKASRVNDKFQEALYLVVELLRAKVLHAGYYGGRVHTGGPMSGSESDKASMLLVMRVLSLVPVTFKPDSWNGPLSRELLVFNSFASAMSRALRCLVEATVANLFLRGDARRAREDYLEISLSLPFTNESNTALGMVFKGYYDVVSHFSSQAGAPIGQGKPVSPDVVDQALDLLAGVFAVVRDIRKELERAWRFWDASLRTDDAITPELAQQFEAANSWLAAVRA